MAFNEYPYTDFHEMNLDWVIKKVKELAAAWAQVQQDWTDEQAAFANLQSWIENYFNNLDVQTEINVKLDAMVAAGTMSELIAPYVASGLPAEVAEQIGAVVAAQIGPVVAAQIGAVVADQLPAVAAAAAASEVSAWLAAHVNPETGYVIDDSLTVQGAAADAKAVGDEFTAIKSALTNVDDKYDSVIAEGDYRRKLLRSEVKIAELDASGVEQTGTKSIVTKDFEYAKKDGYVEVTSTDFYAYLYEYSSASDASFEKRTQFYYGTYVNIPQGKYYKVMVHTDPSTTMDESDVADAMNDTNIVFYDVTDVYDTVMNDYAYAKSKNTVSTTVKKYDCGIGYIINSTTGAVEYSGSLKRMSTVRLMPTLNGCTVSINNSAISGYLYKYDSNGNFVSPRVAISYGGSSIVLEAGTYFRVQLAKTNDTTFDIATNDMVVFSAYVTLVYVTQYGSLYGMISDNVGTSFALTCKNVKDFMNSTAYDSSDYSYTQVTSYLDQKMLRSDQGIPSIISLTPVKDATRVQMLVSVNSNMNGYQTYDVPCGAKTFAVYNLLPNTTYYWKAVYSYADGSKDAKTGSFTTANIPTRMLKIDGIQNVRDIGGYAVTGGKVAYGKIIRGSAMDESEVSYLHIMESGKYDMLQHVGILVDLDLRTGRAASPLGDYVTYESQNIGVYASFSPEGLAAALGIIVTALEANKPIYVHCQGGCDRTGTIVTFLLGLLGVSESDLAKEYELTCFSPIGGGRYRSTNNPDTYNYSGMIAQIKTYTGATLQDKIEAVFIAGGASQTTIDAFKSAMIA